MLNLKQNRQLLDSDIVDIYSINMSNVPVASFRNCIFLSYSDRIKGGFETTSVFGRTDPIYTMGNNSRKINASFISTEVGSEAVRNLQQLSSVGMAMYGQYDNSTRVIRSPPLFVIKFGLFMSPVLGFLDNLEYTIQNPTSPIAIGAMATDNNVTLIAPNSLKIDLDFTVIHTKSIFVAETGLFNAPTEAPFARNK